MMLLDSTSVLIQRWTFGHCECLFCCNVQCSSRNQNLQRREKVEMRQYEYGIGFSVFRENTVAVEQMMTEDENWKNAKCFLLLIPNTSQ